MLNAEDKKLNIVSILLIIYGATGGLLALLILFVAASGELGEALPLSVGGFAAVITGGVAALDLAAGIFGRKTVKDGGGKARAARAGRIIGLVLFVLLGADLLTGLISMSGLSQLPQTLVHLVLIVWYLMLLKKASR